MSSAYIGIDVSIRRGKPLAVAVVTHEHTFLLHDLPPAPGVIKDPTTALEGYQVWGAAVQEAIAERVAAAGLRIERVGIDAPAAFPAKGQVRQCEVAARRITGIYLTPDVDTALHHHSQFYHWMLGGLGIWQAFQPLYPCREVFPHLAFWQRDVRSKKNTIKGLSERQNLLAGLLPLPHQALTHDHLDALMAAYVASRDDAQCVGDANNWADGIWW